MQFKKEKEHIMNITAEEKKALKGPLGISCAGTEIIYRPNYHGGRYTGRP